MILMLNLILSVAIAGLIHEMGHYLTALTFGHHLVFRRQGFRFIWDMPETLTDRQKAIVAISGFVLEIVLAPFLYLAGLTLYPVISIAHFCLYPLYSGEADDFKWIDRL